MVNSQNTDVNITRRVSASSGNGTNTLGPVANTNEQSVKIERWQEKEERVKLKSARRKAALTPRPPHGYYHPVTDSNHRRYSTTHEHSSSKMLHSGPTRIEEFEISEAPEKWQQRKADLVRSRHENMKRILQCFYTIVYEGTMHGYFKSLWDDDEYTYQFKGHKSSTASSHHFSPQYTGRRGFEYLMNMSMEQAKQKRIPPVRLPPQPNATEDTPRTSNTERSSSPREKISSRQTTTRGSTVRRSSESRPSTGSKSSRIAPSADMSQFFESSNPASARDSNHRLQRQKM